MISCYDFPFFFPPLWAVNNTVVMYPVYLWLYQWAGLKCERVIEIWEWPVNIRCWPNVVLMLARRRRRRAKINPALGPRHVLIWVCDTIPSVSRRWTTAELMLGQRRRRCYFIKPVLIQRLSWLGFFMIYQCRNIPTRCYGHWRRQRFAGSLWFVLWTAKCPLKHALRADWKRDPQKKNADHFYF